MLTAALSRDEQPALETFLVARSNLPGPRMNTGLVAVFGRLVGQKVEDPELEISRLESLLDGWAALTVEQAPSNSPLEILPAAAVKAYGEVAVARPDWWEDEAGKLLKAAAVPRWRTGEMVAAAVQNMLKADWNRALKMLEEWVENPDPRVVRAAAASIAEPPLLKAVSRGQEALAIQQKALEAYRKLEPPARRSEAALVLKKGLAFTLSIAVAASPEKGFALLEELGKEPDPDLSWIVRQNLKKARLFFLQPG